VLGRLVGNYRVVAKIGEGGMGVVYLAEHPEIGRKLVVKVLHPHLVSDPQNRARFLNEARAAAAIRHPNIVDVIDVGTLSPEGTPYIVMEHLVGEDLAARIRRRGQLAIPEAIDLAYQTASALGVAHAQGIVHRDLKPANLFVIADDAHPGHDRIKVLDFGVAKLQGAIAGAVRTQSGVFLGTPTYMSPEQCLGTKEVDHRSDIYSLGVILYEMVCGVPPFVSSGMGELVLMHTSHVPVAPRRHNAAIPEALETVILRALAKEPSQRFASAAELQMALTGGAPRAAPPSWDASVAELFAAAVPAPTQGAHTIGATPSTGGHAQAGSPPTAPAQAPHPPGAAPQAPGATPHLPQGSATSGPGVTRAMHYSVVAAPAVDGGRATRRSRAGLWGFIAGATLAAVAAVLFVLGRSSPSPAVADAGVSDARPADPRSERTHADAGEPAHPVDAGRPPRPIDAGAPHPADAGPPHPADAAPPHPADAGPPHPADAGRPPAADAGRPSLDGGPRPIDAGGPPVDAAPPAVDAAPPPVDAGPPPIDAGRPPVDAAPAPIDAGPLPPVPDAGQPVPPSVAQACARSCRKLRSCGLRPGATCEQSCRSSPKVSACAVASPDDCNAAATCELIGQCSGIGPSGTATCKATFACELRCGSDAGCACHCTQQLAPQHATAWLKLERCVAGCRREPACIQRSCRRFTLACDAE
jgi:hypothetical protein